MTHSPEIDHKLLLKRSLLAIDDLKAKLSAFERTAAEPIAIVGTGCRLPGGVESPDAFWDLLVTGTDAVTEVPSDRWDVDAFYDPNPDAIGKSYSRWGAFLDQVDLFDADFFGVSPREAVSLDPQQRLLLEVTWEALENAGIAPARLMGSQTAVYLGISTHDYGNRMLESGQFAKVDAYAVSGTAHSMAAGRIAYVFGFQGPNVAMNTACSSSIVATHLAVQSLRNRETDVALAAGANLTITPSGSILTSRARMASPTGRCHTFDASADGYVRGEGCVVLVLKRLSDAQRDGDRILALVRGSALNQDGRSSGLTAPFGPAQEAVIRSALANARLEPTDISYIEAHGTGTSLGDPIEIKALGESYTRNRSADAPLLVGSVKTNIGHLEGAAGIAGLLKTILSLQHQTIPPHLHFNTPNPLIPWGQYPIQIPTALTPWNPPNGSARRAGISSFGFSGTNGHVILEEAPVSPRNTLSVDRPQHVLPLSARTPESLTDLANRYATYLERDDAAPLADIAATAATGRSHFNERLAIIASSNAEAHEKLRAVAAGQLGPGIVKRRATGSEAPEIVFMCTGQGAQYPNMTRQLYDTQPTFKRVIDQCAELLNKDLDQPLLSILFPADPADTRLHDTTYTQPALFVVEYALAQLWRSWGIEPSIVLGHSVGEYVAACLAGVFSLEDALHLIAARGRLMGRLPHNGSMAAIFADEPSVRTAISAQQDAVSIASVNGPQNTVISGKTSAIENILDRCTSQNIEFQRLNVSHAFHSPLMDSILDEFEEVATTITFSRPNIDLVSNVTGTIVGDEITTPSYWRRHLREAVRFTDSITTIHNAGYHVFLEIGPSPTLLGMARRCLPTEGPIWLASLRKGVDDWSSMLDTLATLYTLGGKVDWTGFDRDYHSGRQRVALPTYPFQRQRFWMTFDADADENTGANDQRPHLLPLQRAHPLVAGRISAASTIFETTISLENFPYLADHHIANLLLFPGTAYMELAMAASQEAFDSSTVSLHDFVIREALVLPGNAPVTLQIIFAPMQNGSTTFQIFSASTRDPNTDPSWRLHATGRASVAPQTATEVISIDALQSACPTLVDVAGYYDTLESVGATYGPTFRGLQEIRKGKNQAVGKIQLPSTDATDTTGYLLHPALFDACIQLTGAALRDSDNTTVSAAEDLYVPIRISDINVAAAAGTNVWCHVSLPEGTSNAEVIAADLTVIANTGHVVAKIHALQLKRMAPSALQQLLGKSNTNWLYEIAWRPTAEPLNTSLNTISEPAHNSTSSTSIANLGRWLIFTDKSGLGSSLANQLRTQNHSVEVIASNNATTNSASNPAADHYVDLTNTDELRNVITKFVHVNNSPLNGVIYLPAVDYTTPPQSLQAVQDSQHELLNSALTIAQSCAESNTPLWFITRGSQAVAGSTSNVIQSPLWGLAGVVATENPALPVSRIDLDPNADTDTNTLENDVAYIAANILSPTTEPQIAFRSGTQYVARLTPNHLAPPSPHAVRLEIPTRGQLDNLSLSPITHTPPQKGQVEIRVHATGLNFRDVLNALGMYPGDPGPLGNECSGVITAIGEDVTDLEVGDEVITMVDKCFATYAIAPAVLTVRKPQGMSFAEAATIPVTFLTADYALNHLGRMKAGDRVLIHAATGGVGMAAIQLARQAGAEIFGTAGSPAKRALAQSLGAHHVSDSRSLSFVQDFERIAGKQGIDIALNSLAGDFIPNSLDLLRPNGRFIEIGKTDVWNETKVTNDYPGLEYYVLYLGDVTATNPQKMRERLLGLLKDFEAGILKPLPQHIFPLEKSVDAFRFMAQAKHTGKVVITQRHNQPLPSKASYLITGGLGGLGLAVARELSERGARQLTLMGRSTPSKAAAQIIDELQQTGVKITVASGDVASSQDVQRIINDIQTSGFPLRGIIHAAGIVDDAMLPDQTWAKTERVLAPKISGAWNLHSITNGIPLDFFVMFSSGAAILSSPGQSNYAAANVFLDALAHTRHALNLPALSINWGSWSDVGMAADVSEQHRRRWAALGLGMIAPNDGVRIMYDLILGATTPQVAVLPLTLAKLQTNTPFLSELRPNATSNNRSTTSSSAAETQSNTTNSNDSVDWHQRINNAPPDKREQELSSFLSEQLIRVLALDASYRVDPHRSIMEMGLDSLMAMELRNRIDTNLHTIVSVADLLIGPTVQQLASKIQSRFATTHTTEREFIHSFITDTELNENIDMLSEAALDAELERLLIETHEVEKRAET